jgi:Tfp pilus assembly protein PilF
MTRDAFVAFQRGLELNSANEQILYNMGIFFYNSGNYLEAERCFESLPPGYRKDVIIPVFDAESSK